MTIATLELITRSHTTPPKLCNHPDHHHDIWSRAGRALRSNKYGDRSGAVSKRFTRLKRALRFGKPHVFHSIRKTVATQFENALVLENIAAAILGHEFDTMSYGVYSGGPSLKVKRAAIEKLRYPR